MSDRAVPLMGVMAAFIFAAVLIGRISIEMGSEHALGYATPLAIVTTLIHQSGRVR